MDSLLENAQKLDEQKQLTDAAIMEMQKRLKEYNRNVAKLNAWMLRTEENPPSDFDIQKLETCMHFFTKK
jgi:hypothetical protein